IRVDMAAPHPMNRLLQGDVGSGKTLVAVLAMLTAIESGFQAALMAPTEILAEQHARTLGALLRSLDIEVALLTNTTRGKERQALLAAIADGTARCVVGTHALVQGGVAFRRLGLAVVDEQHRFGVMQRATLRGKGERPDALVMTATPIPRTLALTLYGDLDLSVLDELPPRRKPVLTWAATGPCGASTSCPPAESPWSPWRGRRPSDAASTSSCAARSRRDGRRTSCA